MDHELDVDRAARLQFARDRARDFEDAALHRLVERLRRVDADRIAGVDAGAFDVFEDAGNENILAVVNGVDFDLEAAQILVDQKRFAAA